MKLFRTVSSDVIKECRCFFGISDAKLIIVKRNMKLLRKYCNSEYGLCKLFADAANLECNMLAIWVVTFVPNYFVCMLICLFAYFLLSAAYYWRIKLLNFNIKRTNTSRPCKGKGKGAYSSSWNSPQNYGTSLVNRITQYYLLPDRGDRPAFIPTGQVGTRFIGPVRMKGWVGLVGWLHTEMVYPSTDGHPSEY